MGTDVSTTSGTNTNFDYTGNSATLSASAEGGFSVDVSNTRGYGVGFSVNGEATSTHNVTTENGVTTYTANTEVSVTVQGEINTPHAGVEIARTDGIELEYQVSMPEDAATPQAMANATFTDPSTMPEGTVIRVDDSQYTSNEFSATFRNIRLSSNITESEGSSMVVEKTSENSVRVTVGPTAGIDAYNGVGVDFGVASASIGNNTSLDSATFQTAEFDLSTPEGQAAYNHFLSTGEMPTQNGNGVSGVQTIEKLDYNSQVSIEASLGPLDVSVDGASSSLNSVRVTEPDGTSSVTSVLQYSGNVPMTVTQQFDAEGNEILAQRTYSYEVQASEDNYQLLNVATTGDVNQAESGPIQPGQTVVITMTHAQMEDYHEQAVDTVEQNHAHFDIGAMALDYDGNPVSTWQFATSIARNIGNSDYGVAETMFTISASADGDYANDSYEALPMTVEVKD